MRKFFLFLALSFSGISLFVQYKSILFAASIIDLVQEFGQILLDGDESEKVTEFFFNQAEEIRLNAQDTFIAQQISLGLLTSAIIFLALAMACDKKGPKVPKASEPSD